jgi:hypothetical protein
VPRAWPAVIKEKFSAKKFLNLAHFYTHLKISQKEKQQGKIAVLAFPLLSFDICGSH